jgi:hypothetical protein
MKAMLLCCLMIAMILGSCYQKKSSKIEGAWNLVYSSTNTGDTVKAYFPNIYKGSQLKMWVDNHFSFVGIFKLDTTTINSYGGGTYSLKDKLYNETVVYHSTQSVAGTTYKMMIEIKNDTLIQTWPVDDNGKIDSASFRIEKYVRL